MNEGFKQAGVFLGWTVIIIFLAALILWSGYVFPDVVGRLDFVAAYGQAFR